MRDIRRLRLHAETQQACLKLFYRKYISVNVYTSYIEDKKNKLSYSTLTYYPFRDQFTFTCVPAFRRNIDHSITIERREFSHMLKIELGKEVQ